MMNTCVKLCQSDLLAYCELHSEKGLIQHENERKNMYMFMVSEQF